MSFPVSPVRVTRQKRVPVSASNCSQQCRQWMVLMGPLSALQLMGALRAASTWCLAIVAQQPGPAARAVLYITPSMNSNFQVARILSQNLFFWKNVAYLHAIQCGAQVIYDTDRHHLALLAAAEVGQERLWDEELHGTKWTWVASTGALNVYPALLGQPAKPRGFPPQLLYDRRPAQLQYPPTNQTDPAFSAVVDIAQLVPAVCPDVVATTAVPTGTGAALGSPKRFAAVSGKAIAPFNTRSTLFLRDAFWALLLPVSASPCISDVWRAFITQRVMAQTRQAVGFLGPWLARRNACGGPNVVLLAPVNASSRRECPTSLYMDSQKLLNVLRYSSAVEAPTVGDLLPQLASVLVRHRLLQPADVRLATAWVADLRALGLRFPSLKVSLPTNVWPDLHLFLPLFSRHFLLFRDVFWNSTVHFWPLAHLKLTIVADAEDVALQPLLQPFLAGLPPLLRRAIRVVLNPITPFYSHGHDRQQFFMFFADHYCDGEYIGFVDTDCLFVTPVVYSDLFTGGKPVVIGAIGKRLIGDGFWADTPRATHFFLGKPEVARGMNYFPVLLHRSHLAALRTHVEQLHRAPFAEVFQSNKGAYSQFNIMVTFLWYFHRDEYQWHLEDRRPGKGPYSVTDFEAIGLQPEHLRPKARVAIHFRYHGGKRRGPTGLMREGNCRAGWLPAHSCTKYNVSSIHRDLFVFEYHAWTDVADCTAANAEHYAAVHAAKQAARSTPWQPPT
eukprot:EG_transcript_3809